MDERAATCVADVAMGINHSGGHSLSAVPTGFLILRFEVWDEPWSNTKFWILGRGVSNLISGWAREPKPSSPLTELPSCANLAVTLDAPRVTRSVVLRVLDVAGVSGWAPRSCLDCATAYPPC